MMPIKHTNMPPPQCPDCLRFLEERSYSEQEEHAAVSPWDSFHSHARRVQRYGESVSVGAAKLLDWLVEIGGQGGCVISNDEIARTLRWKHALVTVRLRELEQAGLICRHIDLHMNRPGKRVIHLLCR